VTVGPGSAGQVDSETDMTVRCRYCNARPGQLCRSKGKGNDWRVSYHMHAVRVNDARRVMRIGRVHWCMIMGKER
jgi:hypothetical protein